jgi:hypothetical protein
VRIVSLLPSATEILEDIYSLDEGALRDLGADAAYVRPGRRLVESVEVLSAIFHPEQCCSRPELVQI